LQSLAGAPLHRTDRIGTIELVATDDGFRLTGE
jgi:hypothetical protein